MRNLQDNWRHDADKHNGKDGVEMRSILLSNRQQVQQPPRQTSTSTLRLVTRPKIQKATPLVTSDASAAAILPFLCARQFQTAFPDTSRIESQEPKTSPVNVSTTFVFPLFNSTPSGVTCSWSRCRARSARLRLEWCPLTVVTISSANL
jgi:hypothetical protein